MGSQALTSLLHKHSVPHVKCFSAGEAASLRNNLLLVDAASVCNLLRKRHGIIDGNSCDFHAPLYQATVAYFRGLQRTGLELIVFFDSAISPMHEQNFVQLHHGAVHVPPTVQMIFHQAVIDLDLKVEHSVNCAQKLLLAYYAANKESVFAVLSCESDCFVYGMDKVIDAKDVVVDHQSTTLHIWSCGETWRKLNSYATGRIPSPVSLMQRAQVAAMLGNSNRKDVRHRMSSRQLTAAAGGNAKGQVMSVTLAGLEVLRRSYGDMLELDFFQKEPLNMKQFDAESLAQYNAVVQQYIDSDAWAKTPSALASMRVSTETVPWLHPHLVEHITKHVVPPFLKSISCRGLGCVYTEEPTWGLLQGLRARTASQLGPKVTAVFEYNVNSSSLHQLSHASFEAPSDWFVPAVHLPGMAVTDSSSKECSAVKRSSPQLTAQAIRDLEPTLPESLVRMYTVLLHTLEADSAYDVAAVRDLLLPGVPPAVSGDSKTAPVALEQVATARPPWQEGANVNGVVEVGNSLGEEDWKDIDDKGVVGKTQSSAGFALMKKIQPWDASALHVSNQLPVSQLFRFFYSHTQKQENPWKDMMKACFPEQYKATKKGDKAELKALKKDLTAKSPSDILTDLTTKASKGGPDASSAGYAAAWAGRVQSFIASKSAKGMLSLWRDATTSGPQSIQWTVAQMCWSSCNPIIKKQALVDAWSCDNRPQLNSGGPPMMYPHQQSLMDQIEEHLTEVQKLARVQKAPLPLHVIFSTPTGSGKTFTAVMTYLKLIQEIEVNGNMIQEGHEDTIVVYSVPTKQVLKRVGQECEAHGIVYWTAAQAGGKGLHEVRRPYSIRTLGGRKVVGGRIGSGSMRDQLEQCSTQGSLNKDRGGGMPAFIVADLHSTAAIMQAAATASPDSFFHSSKLLLYFDEPNMGIHLDKDVESVVCSIMMHAPITTVLASATLGSWDELPPWWKGQGQPATRTIITQEPYSLPMSKLCVLDKNKGQLAPVNALQLFQSSKEFVQVLGQSPRLRVLLMRHFSPAQANEIVGLRPESVETDPTPTSRESEGGEAVEAGGDEWLSTILGQDMASLREGLLESELSSLSSETFYQLRDQAWAEPPKHCPSMRDVISQKGVTLIATLDPRQLAFEVAGKWSDEVRWSETAHDIKAKISAAKQKQMTAAKESRRTQKKGDDDASPAMASEGNAVVTLRTGLWVDLEDAKDTDIDILVMLARGVAYACCTGTEALVKRLYQQALLYVPEKASSQPPISVLVVDYSSVYGTDCPAVDVIIMCEDLGAHMSWEDHQQFIGRLRRDGTCIYPSLKMLRWATVRSVSEAVDDETETKLFRSVSNELQKALMRHVNSETADVKAVEAEMIEIAKSCSVGKTTGRAEIACTVLTTCLRSLLPLPPLDDNVDDPTLNKKAKVAAAVQLLKSACARLKKWGPISPIDLIKLPRTAGEQVKLLNELDKLCGCDVKSERPSILVPPAPGGGEFVPIAGKLMEWLYDEDAFKEELVLSWAKSAPKTSFRTALDDFIQWLEEADSEEESD